MRNKRKSLEIVGNIEYLLADILIATSVPK
jgi:hypothetical protein